MNRQLASVQFVGGTNDDPDYVYYNADIINNTTADQRQNGEAVLDPNIVFNEQRDAPILKDVSNYNFSIVRFTMNGANLDLPLFIPSIREGTGQLNPNLTNYALAVPYQQSFTANGASIPNWDSATRYYLNDIVLYTTNSHYYQCINTNFNGVAGVNPTDQGVLGRTTWQDLGTEAPTGVSITVIPKERFVQYATQDRNKILAPTPLSLANVKFKGQYSDIIQYKSGDIVSVNANDIDPVTGLPTYIYNTNNGPFYQAVSPTQLWSATKSYVQYDFVTYNGQSWYCSSQTGVVAGADPPALYPPLGTGPINWTLGIPQSLTNGWKAGTQYKTDDVVLYGSTLYQSVSPPTPTPVPVAWSGQYPFGIYQTVGTVVKYTNPSGSSTYWTSLQPVGNTYDPTITTPVGTIVSYNDIVGQVRLYQALVDVPPSLNPFIAPAGIWSSQVFTPNADSYNWSGPNPFSILLPPPLAPLGEWTTTITTPLVPVDITNSPFWNLITSDLGLQQDLSSDYYWIYNYQTWIDLVNETILDPTNLSYAFGRDKNVYPSTCCMCDTYDAFVASWNSVYGDLINFPSDFGTLQGFLNNSALPPQFQYDGASGKFSILFDNRGYGQRISTFTPQPESPSLPVTTPPSFKLFMNTNMYNLFANFPFLYWNVGEFNWVYNYANSALYYNGLLESGPFVVPVGYTYEIVVPNEGFKNVIDYTVQAWMPNAPLAYRQVYWNVTQEQKSTDTLWSPISTIVFTTALMPIKPESTASPVLLGQNNIGNSQPTAQSAFTRIITDIALDLAQGGAGAYKSFIYYVPSAEYRLSDFLSSHQPLSGVDVQVFWKNRLNNQLYPIAMTNLSSVSFKLMFKKKGLATKADDT